MNNKKYSPISKQNPSPFLRKLQFCRSLPSAPVPFGFAEGLPPPFVSL